jgi:DNA-binding PadR family transcriptional regulator
MAGLPTTSFALLGLLLQSPMSGYELASRVDQSIGNFWPIARSQVYGELARLESLGYLEGSDVAQDRLPDKRVFRVTEPGRAALDGWLVDGDVPVDRVRSVLLVQLFLAARMPVDVLAAMLADVRTRAEADRDRFAEIAARLDGLPGWVEPRVTALYGLRHAEATLAWLDEIAPLLERST